MERATDTHPESRAFQKYKTGATMKVLLTIAAASLLAASFATPALAQGAGAATYKAKCQMCHGADGQPTAAGKSMKALPLNSPELKKASTASLIASVTNGKGKMPAYAGKLTDAQIKEVVEYTRTLQ
jgi:mono/diheme cytochrome c family protein